MAKLSYEEYEKFNSKSGEQSQRSLIRFFALKDDGETAIVRFNIHTLADIAVSSVHTVENMEDGKKRYRIVSCIRSSFNDPVEKCPLCEAGNKMSFKIFVPLVAYNQDENGNIIADAMIWQQGTRIRQTLKSFIDDYGDLSDMLFKITRHGKKGDVNTTYSILPANPNVYKSTIYVKDFSAFEKNPNYLDNFVHERTADDMNIYLDTGSFPNPYVNKEPNQTPYDRTATPTAPASMVEEETPIVGQVNPATARRFDGQQLRTPNQGTTQNPTPVRRYTY